MNKKNKPHNRLIYEKSPYRLQYAYNPVDWYPWSNEAFAKDKVEDKPIFLSIDYSTCHGWQSNYYNQYKFYSFLKSVLL